MSILRGLKMWKLRLPMRVTFKHASASRRVTESVWVEASDGDGNVGYGEGCPRSYVTGETADSCGQFFGAHREALLERVDSVEALVDWAGEKRAEIDAAPAAWCGIELALLDLFARREGRSVESLLGMGEVGGVYSYTAVLGDQDDEGFAGQLAKYRGWGFEDFKIKLSGDPARDGAKFDRLGEAGVDAGRVRVDANNLWESGVAAARHLDAFAGRFCAVEEPIRANRIGDLRQLAGVLGVPAILDESFLRVGQFGEIEEDPERWWINLRVSKMGGLVRSSEVARGAAGRGIGVVVGAQVGETSLLTRAALGVAGEMGAVLRGQEGAFGTHLLEADVVGRPLMFGARGRLDLADFPEVKLPVAVLRPDDFLEAF